MTSNNNKPRTATVPLRLLAEQPVPCTPVDEIGPRRKFLGRDQLLSLAEAQLIIQRVDDRTRRDTREALVPTMNAINENAALLTATLRAVEQLRQHVEATSWAGRKRRLRNWLVRRLGLNRPVLDAPSPVYTAEVEAVSLFAEGMARPEPDAHRRQGRD